MTRIHSDRTRIDPAEFLANLLREPSVEPAPPTAIESFARKHDAGEFEPGSARYRGQIPTSLPDVGQQFAFEVDLDRCSGCKACVTACHSLNGLEANETWRQVGLLRGGTTEAAVQQHVTAACHHCLEPACAAGCPVDAYEKDPVTGIVRHLDDQCIGCQYCTLKCPYDVPTYSKEMGIVRKCDMCTDRLQVGEAPACVQACPTQAIRIVTVDTHSVVERSEATSLVPGAPASDYTLPTTTYTSAKPLPTNMLPSDYSVWRPEHSHPPLIIMLVLSQLSVGAFCIDFLMNMMAPNDRVALLQPLHSGAALVVGLLSLGAATLHLGRPLLAWRAFIGLRHSWLSREIVAFGIFATLAVVYALVSSAGIIAAHTDTVPPSWLMAPGLASGLGLAVAIWGVIGVLCSVMIYGDCNREGWRESITGMKFFGSSLVLGLATVLLTGVAGSVLVSGVAPGTAYAVYIRPLATLLITASAIKLLWDVSILRHLTRRTASLPKRTARLMVTDLQAATLLRFVAGGVGGLLLPAALLGLGTSGSTVHVIALAVATLLLCLTGEFAERFLFFTAVARKRMPGGAL